MSSKSLHIVAIALTLIFTAYLPDARAGIGIMFNQVVVSANDPDTGECEVGPVDMNTGQYSVMAKPGCDECGGVDQDADGNMYVVCAGDGPVATGVANSAGLVGAVVEFDAVNGTQISSNIHGVSNYISDIAILPNRLIVSHETLDEDTIHKHAREDNYVAVPQGQTGLNVNQGGLADIPASSYLTLAANVDGTPALYKVDEDTGEATFKRVLSFPAVIAAAGADIATRAVAAADIQIVAMKELQTTDFFMTIVLAEPRTSGATRAVAFAIQEADYIALLKKDYEDPPGLSGWAAIALIDDETGLVDYITEIQSPRDLDFTGITLLQPVQRNVPTLSEWSLITTAVVLGFVGFITIRKRKLRV